MVNALARTAESHRDSRADLRQEPAQAPAESEITRVLKRAATEAAQAHRAEELNGSGIVTAIEQQIADAAELPCSPEEIAQALPGWKRAIDLALIILSLPLWLPVMVLCALWVAVTSPGPIFYRQPRVGFKGRRFMIVKLRTMKVNAETHVHESYLQHLMVNDRPMIKLDAHGDPRLILGGKFLRATGLDELPQLFNVIKGHMSIVGPRPCTVQEFGRLAPEYRARVNAFPGMTGLWQVNGKNRTTFRQMIEMDIFYSRNISFWLDARIIARTLPAILGQVSDTWQPVPPIASTARPTVKT